VQHIIEKIYHPAVSRRYANAAVEHNRNGGWVG